MIFGASLPRMFLRASLPGMLFPAPLLNSSPMLSGALRPVFYKASLLKLFANALRWP